MLRTDTKLSQRKELLLSLLPFVLLIGLYIAGAYYLRYQEACGTATASSRLMPLPSEMWEGFLSVATAKGDYQLWRDTWSSLKLFAMGMSLVSVGVLIGLFMGVFPALDAFGARFITYSHKLPPLLLLGIFLCWLGIGDLAKVALVVFGVLPSVVLDAYLQAKSFPRKEFYKAQTLRASEDEIACSIVLPQIFPQTLDTLRLNFNAAWCYVIASEGLASSEGIGYRINLLSHHLAMDKILPYVIWATLLVFTLDYLVQRWISSYRWFRK